MPKKKKKPLAKNKKINTKMSVRRRNLKKQVKGKFGNALAPCLTQLSTDELANLLTGAIDANTLKKYDWFFKPVRYTGQDNRRHQRNWLKSKLSQYKNRDEEYIYKIFKGRKPNDVALANVLNKGKKQWKTWGDVIKMGEKG